MAISQAFCTSAKVELLNGIHAFSTTVTRGSTAADTFKIALFTSSATLGALRFWTLRTRLGRRQLSLPTALWFTIAPSRASHLRCWLLVAIKLRLLVTLRSSSRQTTRPMLLLGSFKYLIIKAF